MFFDLPEAFIFVGVLQNCFVTTETFLVLVFFVFIYNQNGILIDFIPLPLLSPWLLLLFVHQTHYIQTLRAELKLN